MTQAAAAGATSGDPGCGGDLRSEELTRLEWVRHSASAVAPGSTCSAKRQVGPRGFVYGVDMTDEMLELARVDQLRAGVKNARFLKGTIVNIRRFDRGVDMVISNRVINLAG